MNPSQVSAELRRIATAINNSQNPSRERVLDDLRRVLASMDETAGMDHEAGLKEKFVSLGAALLAALSTPACDIDARAEHKKALGQAITAYAESHGVGEKEASNKVRGQIEAKLLDQIGHETPDIVIECEYDNSRKVLKCGAPDVDGVKEYQEIEIKVGK